jgi:hypothetical protein
MIAHTAPSVHSPARIMTWLRCRSCQSGYFAAGGRLQPVGLWDLAHEAAPDGIRQRGEVSRAYLG